MSMNQRNNDTTRPRKSGAAKKRRFLEHKRRLMALGVSAEKIEHMSSAQIRIAIAKPKIRKQFVS